MFQKQRSGSPAGDHQVRKVSHNHLSQLIMFRRHLGLLLLLLLLLLFLLPPPLYLFLPRLSLHLELFLLPLLLPLRGVLRQTRMR